MKGKDSIGRSSHSLPVRGKKTVDMEILLTSWDGDRKSIYLIHQDND